MMDNFTINFAGFIIHADEIELMEVRMTLFSPNEFIGCSSTYFNTSSNFLPAFTMGLFKKWV